MQCEAISESLAGVVDGDARLDRGERRHVERCLRCQAELAGVGAAIERLAGRDGYGDTLIARTPGEGAPLVVAGHVDTVWDHGTLAKSMPWRVEGDRAHGPGIYDMKAGSFFAFHSVREILRQGTKTKRPITLLLTPDEEVGTPATRGLSENAARGQRAVGGRASAGTFRRSGDGGGQAAAGDASRPGRLRREGLAAAGGDPAG